MAGKVQHRPEVIAHALKQLKEGKDTVSKIAREVSVNRATVAHWKGWLDDGRVHESPDGFSLDGVFLGDGLEHPALQRALAAELKRANVKAAKGPMEEDLHAIARSWDITERSNAERIRNQLNEPRFEWTASDGKPVGVSFLSDQHITLGAATDLAQMRDDAEIIHATPGMHAMLGGDGVDNHLKHRAALINARSNPSDQYRFYNYYLSILEEDLVVVISGNHDDWTKDFAGIDQVKNLCRRRKVCYSPDFAIVTCNIGNQVYRVLIRHQYRYGSSFNLGHTVKRLWEMGDHEFDVGVVCHHHEPHIENFTKHGMQRWAIRPGSYQIMSAYSRRYGFNNAQPTSPTIIFDPETRDMTGFDDVRKAAIYLKAVRGD